MIDKIFLIVLCGLPFSHLLFQKLDIWHGHGHWFQIGILVLVCCSLIEKPKSVQIVNKPLAVFTLWAGLITAYYWYIVVVIQKNYPIKIFFPFFNFLCFILFYKLSIEYLNKEKIEKIFKYLSYSVLLVMGYCVLQKLNLDQFYASLEGRKAPNELVGTIGNTSHLAGYLALCQPLYFTKGIRNYLSLILLWLIILVTGSVSGIVAGIGILAFWLVFKRQYKWLILLLGVCLLGGIGLFIKKPEFFTFSHRVELWQLLYQNFRIKSITGAGLGIMNAWQLAPEVSVWRHAHLEYFQIAVELGLIGLGFLLWCIWEYFRMFKTFRTDLTIKLASMFFGFCVLGLFTFPAHLWLMSSMGMISYSFLFCLKGENANGY